MRATARCASSIRVKACKRIAEVYSTAAVGGQAGCAATLSGDTSIAAARASLVGDSGAGRAGVGR